ncbi:hypothetical protein Pflav_064440 [Phytohabitans flavus]|uniref:Uncharacterized protein n=1 Tax=Phytohabitans flavus TaxID=1076124 RepID=A0A6F8Y1Q1_9ACTN|nr:hypothetical protein Pflav_064440 [Phytohabitans flavus]
MDRPVGPTLFGELAGAVERIDDPDPLGLQPCGRLGTVTLGPCLPGVVVFLRQHRVGWAPPPKLGADQVVGELVAGRLERGRVGVTALGPHLEQQLTGTPREPPSERAVDRWGRHQYAPRTGPPLKRCAP